MNPLIQKYFQNIEIRLIGSSVITSYQIIRQEIAPDNGKLRIKIIFTDESLIEFFEYVEEYLGCIRILKYSFHWQNKYGQLIKRWDNAPHHAELACFPHHVHYEDGSVKGVEQIPDAIFIIDEVEKLISFSSEREFIGRNE